MTVIAKTPPRGNSAGLNGSASSSAFPQTPQTNTPDQATASRANAQLAEIKRGSIWTLARLAREHLDRLLWAVGEEDDLETRDQCRAVVAQVRALAILVNDLGGVS